MDRIFTLGYFVPTMIRLTAAADSPTSASTALEWASLNHVRHLLVLTAWLCALKAFAVIHARRD